MNSNFTSIFANCSKHYEIEPLFELCVDTTNPCKSIADIETSIVIIYVDFYFSTALFLVSILINLYCLLLTCIMYRKMQEDSKKKYVFLISRCTSSLSSALAWLLIQCFYIRFLPLIPANFPYYVIALTLYDASIYGMLGSYVGMSLLLYLGVLFPAAFHHRVSLRFLYGSVNVIAVASFGLSIPLAIYQAAISIPGILDCTDKTCTSLVTLINFVLVTGSLLITTSVLLFVIYSIRRHRNEMKKTETLSNSSLNSAFHLLCWTFFAIMLITAAEIVPFAISATKKHTVNTTCYSFEHSSSVVLDACLTLTETTIWAVALIIDPLANILFDRTVSRKAMEQFRWVSRKMTRQSANRSEVCQRHTTDSNADSVPDGPVDPLKFSDSLESR